MNTKVVDVKIKKLFNLAFVIQGILLLLLMIIIIIFVFNHKIYNIFYGICAANLLMLTYNNYKYFHKKYMGYFYIIFAIYLIISIIIDLC